MTDYEDRLLLARYMVEDAEEDFWEDQEEARARGAGCTPRRHRALPPKAV